jgi:hypothetical protein
MVLICGPVSIHRGFVGRQMSKSWCREEGETCGWFRMRSLRLAVARRLPQNPRESGASHVLDHLQLTLELVPLVLVLMCASSSRYSVRA